MHIDAMSMFTTVCWLWLCFICVYNIIERIDWHLVSVDLLRFGSIVRFGRLLFLACGKANRHVRVNEV